jgi:ATP-dependent Clp protease protease subunit
MSEQEEQVGTEEEEETVELPAGINLIGLFGDVSEKKAEEAIYALKTLEILETEEFEFYISTHGGNASDMFAIYDMMRLTRDKCNIATVGLGKVMSAGVLLLAAGTKGKRKVGKNCRIMIHSVIGGSAGPLHDLENEMKEINKMQEMYIDALCDESDLTRGKIRDLFSKNVNIYLSAKEAVEYGIADLII